MPCIFVKSTCWWVLAAGGYSQREVAKMLCCKDWSTKFCDTTETCVSGGLEVGGV